ncbi:pseudaminic acid cytidylyltransferase [Shewanella aestuarii]|uniref:Pseudaminic acid cytidylyltransferase n=1 Tax=Shewanella aestuarii TaxID=1028752 RepID=A0A6G9QHI2_9GAMM|nr:pseudaminic acid cytidylyltransferase [Shewanella aestuarii]QIR13956.1 pseudaminic acid cytidylyltransferase [Shewanella aestuarii]
MNVAIIPARGGSKRIPHKNIKPFNAKPMIAYAIETAINSQCFDKVIVSTDCEAIANIARQYGAEVPFMRPATLADDFTGTTAVIKHALAEIQKQGWILDYCCCIYATTPLMQASSLINAKHTLLNNPELDYVFSACEFTFPIQRALLQNHDGTVTVFDPVSISKRSQDLPKTYHDAGQFYWGKVSAFSDDSTTVFGPKSQMEVLPSYLVADIDTIDDWQRAEVLYQVLTSQGKI